MTFVVYSKKERCLAADKLVIDVYFSNQINIVTKKYQSKLKISEDKHFAYVFLDKQFEELVPLILNHLYRYERGILEELKDPIIIKGDKERFSENRVELIVISSQALYKVVVANNSGELNFYKLNDSEGIMGNLLSIKPLINALELSIDELFEIAEQSNEFFITNHKFKDKVYQKDLIAIKKSKSKGNKKC